MSEIILDKIIIKAKTPSGCELKDPAKSPLNKNDIEFPSPHPGQKSNPKSATGQNVT